MLYLDLNNISVDKLYFPLLGEKNQQLSVLRLDKVHPLISGNKWFKLRFYIAEAKALKKKTILTFGGAWSNHILAVAAACQLEGFHAVGIIRGEEPAVLSSTLIEANSLGMELVFISRDDYQRKKIPARFNKEDVYIINEGGYGIKGAAGAATMLDYCEKESFTHIACACGTGTMLAGLVMGSNSNQSIIGISVLKNNYQLAHDTNALADNEKNNLAIIPDYHFGGYAKYTSDLISFMNDYFQTTNIPSDFVYTAKLFFAVNDLMRNNFFPANSKILMIHSGGLQGNTSLAPGTLIF